MKHAAHYLYIDGYVLPYPLVEEVACGVFRVSKLDGEVAATSFDGGYIALLRSDESVPTHLSFPHRGELTRDFDAILPLLRIPRRFVHISRETFG